MIRGLYTASSGMMVQMTRQDVLSNNLANVNTAGFKKDVVVSQDFPSMLLERMGETERRGSAPRPAEPVRIGSLGTGTAIADIFTDHSLGSLRATQNPLDFALGPDTYFMVETPQGTAYTRNGAFTLNADGRLVTGSGYAVMGKEGYIESEEKMDFDGQGNVLQDGEIINAFNIVRVNDPDRFSKIGDDLLVLEGQDPEVLDNPQVMLGHLEISNVNAIQEMVDLITVVRSYEVLQKVIQSQDSTLDKVINQVGRL
ncbi:MAG: flagellar hook-basal body protein [Syntrophomonadaceae bacterium]|nr:flagellar hook-basal body protein [Syntrophomonadaceae bacterium]